MSLPKIFRDDLLQGRIKDDGVGNYSEYTGREMVCQFVDIPQNKKGLPSWQPSEFLGSGARI